VFAGCSSTTSASELEPQIATSVEELLGEAPEDVSCPGDIEEVGQTITCDITTADGTTEKVDFKITGETDDSWQYEVVPPA
jgi:hypothetical protein